MGYALAACPTKSTTCGSQKYFRFGSEWTSSDGTVNAAMDEADILIESNTMPSTETCTYILRSECGLPGFAMKGDNELTDSDMTISILEWSENFVLPADDRLAFISTSYLDTFE